MTFADPQILLAAAALIGNLSSLVWAIRRPAGRTRLDPEAACGRCPGKPRTIASNPLRIKYRTSVPSPDQALSSRSSASIRIAAWTAMRVGPTGAYCGWPKPNAIDSPEAWRYVPASNWPTPSTYKVRSG